MIMSDFTTLIQISAELRNSLQKVTFDQGLLSEHIIIKYNVKYTCKILNVSMDFQVLKFYNY